MLSLLRSVLRMSHLSEILEKKETHAYFSVTLQSVKVTTTERDKFLVKMQKALHFRV